MSGIFTMLIALGLWLWLPARNIDDRREQSRYTLVLIDRAQAKGYLKKDDPMIEAKAKLKSMFELTQNNSSPLSRALGEDDLRK